MKIQTLVCKIYELEDLYGEDLGYRQACEDIVDLLGGYEDKEIGDEPNDSKLVAEGLAYLEQAYEALGMGIKTLNE